MRDVRIREGEFEGKCDYCGEYLPLTFEFWPRENHGLRRCKACLREYKRLRQEKYKGSLRLAVWRANQRVHYRSLAPEERARRLEANRQWKAAHREHIAAYNRAYRERRKAA
jgi:hypothetical protein